MRWAEEPSVSCKDCSFFDFYPIDWFAYRNYSFVNSQAGKSWKVLFTQIRPPRWNQPIFCRVLSLKVLSKMKSVHGQSSYSVQMRENTNQKNSESGHFPRNDTHTHTGRKFYLLQYTVTFCLMMKFSFFYKKISFLCSSYVTIV